MRAIFVGQFVFVLGMDAFESGARLLIVVDPSFLYFIIFLADGDTDDDLGAGVPFAIDEDMTLVQGREAFYEGEPDAGTEMRFGDLVIALEKMRDGILRDADAIVHHAQINIFLSLVIIFQDQLVLKSGLEIIEGLADLRSDGTPVIRIFE